MLAFSNDYYGIIFRATQSVELFCLRDESKAASVVPETVIFLIFFIKLCFIPIASNQDIWHPVWDYTYDGYGFANHLGCIR